jgi:hypothetical protein
MLLLALGQEHYRIVDMSTADYWTRGWQTIGRKDGIILDRTMGEYKADRLQNIGRKYGRILYRKRTEEYLTEG